jgi:hypothetical protein
MNTIQYRLTVCSLIALSSILFSCSLKVQADTPAQTQKAIQVACNHAAASFDRRDLSGFVALYAPNFTEESVPGRKSNRLQLIAGTASFFANNNEKTTSSCTVSQVVLQGSQAKAILHWDHITRSLRLVPAYTILRDVQVRTIWKKTAGSWQEASADVTRSVVEYRR